ncbi:MAG TPA: cellulose binding domain-containing protein [Micromonosporaceae bacterium]|nr:cellulose binding domain-containing protein [Micromonosporaceae bacterium]
MLTSTTIIVNNHLSEVGCMECLGRQTRRGGDMSQVANRIWRSAHRPRWLIAPLAAALLVLTLAAPAAAAEPDTMRPTMPGPAVASDVTTDSVTLRWDASTDNVGVAGYYVHVLYGDTAERRTTTTNSITITGLVPSRTYWFRVTAFDAAGNQTSSFTILIVTMAPGDVVGPSAPGTPTASQIGPNSVRLEWPRSTDDLYVRSYNIFRIEGGRQTLWTSVPGHLTSATVTGLQSGTPYTFAISASDAAGNVSLLSAPVHVTTASTLPVLCQVQYRVTREWPGGFQAAVRITNVTGSPVSTWKATWAFPDGQTVGHLWGGVLESQTDGSVTVRNAAWNGTIAPQSSVDFGFVGTGSTPTGPPGIFGVNNVGCFRA